MKIIQILPELNAGGVERGTLELARYLVEAGHESIVLSNGGRLVGQLEAGGSRHIQLPVHRKHPSALLQIRKLRRCFEQERPDVIHLRSRLPAWLAWLAWRKMDPARRPRLITTVHGFNSVNRYSKIMTCGESVICVSNSVRDYILKNYPDVPSERLRVIHRGIDPAEFPYGYRPGEAWLAAWYAQFPETRGKCLITLPGRITRLKGHEDFFQLLAALDDPRFHGIVAGGAEAKKQAYLAELEERARQLGIADRLSFTGHRSDLREVLALSDVVLSLTQQPESFGRTTLEALSLGRPVLGYDHGGVGEILEALFPEGKIPVGDLKTLEQRIRAWSEEPGIPKPHTQFTLKQMLQQTLAVYEGG